eukprot:1158363-Pelagomonas_calceolata.AAC.3
MDDCMQLHFLLALVIRYRMHPQVLPSSTTPVSRTLLASKAGIFSASSKSCNTISFPTTVLFTASLLDCTNRKIGSIWIVHAASHTTRLLHRLPYPSHQFSHIAPSSMQQATKRAAGDFFLVPLDVYKCLVPLNVFHCVHHIDLALTVCPYCASDLFG